MARIFLAGWGTRDITINAGDIEIAQRLKPDNAAPALTGSNAIVKFSKLNSFLAQFNTKLKNIPANELVADGLRSAINLEQAKE